MAHLEGKKENCSDVVGLYPMHSDNTCNYIIFDFDNHNQPEKDSSFKKEIVTISNTINDIGISHLLERSQSGNGYHVWIFFNKNINAKIARRFGDLLALKVQELSHLSNFDFFDRLIPMQDKLPINASTKQQGLGNLVALPLQGQALRKGNSAFIDSNLNAYNDQWAVLASTQKLDYEYISSKIAEWENICDTSLIDINKNDKFNNDDLHGKLRSNNKPWETVSDMCNKSDCDGKVKIIFSDKVYINSTNISQHLQAYLRRLAAFGNPVFYKNLALGFSNYKTPRIIDSGYVEDGYICLPRGLLDTVIESLDKFGIEYVIEDKSNCGRKINVSFNGNLYPEQRDAVESLIKYKSGILAATTAFGKTVVGAKIISTYKVNTLIIVHNKEILENWCSNLSRFLEINEDLPKYITKTGRVKTRKNIIGKLYSSHNSMTGIIDVAMFSSFGKELNINPRIKDYGLLIMDECHHGAATTVEQVLGASNAKYVYGLTATPKREDMMEKKIFMQFGPIRYRYTAKQRVQKQGIPHYVYPRFTNCASEKKLSFYESKQLVISSEIRNQIIINDVIDCVKGGRNPIVLSGFCEHSEYLYNKLQGTADNILLLYGGAKKSEKDKKREELKSIPEHESVILVATGQYIGEGFDFPRLDTLMLATPVSYSNVVEQYAGRLHRDYKNKKDVIVYDYVDKNIPVLQRMYYKRMKAYKKMGYKIASSTKEFDILTNSFFDYDKYFDYFVKDILNAKKSVFISSPKVCSKKVSKLIELYNQISVNGVEVIVSTDSAFSYGKKYLETMDNILNKIKTSKITLNLYENLHEQFCIIDNKLVWYGNTNILGNPNVADNIMRISDKCIAEDLKNYFLSK